MRRSATCGSGVFTLTLGVGLLLVAVARGVAQVPSRYTPHIVHGLTTSDYPTTAALLYGTRASTAALLCSGTLIGCQTFLTAAHCVCNGNGTDCQGANAPAPGKYFVFLQHAGIFGVASIAVHPDYQQTGVGVGDLAVLTLDAPVSGIAPAPINTAPAVALGTPGTIVGFGSGGGQSVVDAGLKRVGKVTTATCPSFVNNATSLCWNYNLPLGSAGSNSNTCYGDSGGPLFIDWGTGPVLAGVTTGGINFMCQTPDSSFDVNVGSYAAWIQAQGGADLNNAACGTLPQVGTPDVSTSAASPALSSGTPADAQSFEVPSGKTLLRVAFNAVENYTTNFDLYVRAGSPATPQQYDCRAVGSGQFGVCEFHNPTPGTWYALMSGASSFGAYQLTITAFGTDCSDPANVGAACDDGNPCTESDTCQAGACAGSVRPPLTGCQQPVAGKGMLSLQDALIDARDRLLWTWTKGSATAKADFGDPMHSTDYALCVYDNHGGADSLLVGRSIPAAGWCDGGRGGKPCWAERPSGYVFKDPRLNNGGVQRVTLRAGADGAATIAVKAVGTKLQLPAVSIEPQDTITLQLSNGDRCWEGQFQTNSVSGIPRFYAAPR